MFIFVVVWSTCIFVAALGTLAHLDVIVTENTSTLEAARNIFTVAAGFIAFPMALYGMHMKKEDLQIKRHEAGKTSDEGDIGEDEGEEQIYYIQRLISTHFEKIFSAPTFSPPEEGRPPIPSDAVRFALFTKFETAFEVAIESRTSSLGNQKRTDLKQALADMRRMMDNLLLTNRKTLPLAMARSFYEGLQNLQWLELPELQAEVEQ